MSRKGESGKRKEANQIVFPFVQINELINLILEERVAVLVMPVGLGVFSEK